LMTASSQTLVGFAQAFGPCWHGEPRNATWAFLGLDLLLISSLALRRYVRAVTGQFQANQGW
jgi:hypothetical protein